MPTAVPDPHHILALLNAGRLAEARTAAHALAASRPRDARIQRLLGTVLRTAGEVFAARDAFRKAVRLAPRDADAWSDYGQCLLAHGDAHRAVRTLRKALAVQPGHVLARHNLGVALMTAGDEDAAERELRQVMAKAPALGGAPFELAGLVVGRDPAEAVALLRTAAALMPDYGPAHLRLALAAERAGDTALAERHRAQALALRPAEAQAVFDSRAYLAQAAPAAPVHASRFDLLGHALGQAPPHGMVLEFGVRWGVSVSWLARHGVARVDGFDSFEGLPAAWKPGEGKGAYSTAGEIPEVPNGVHLHRGWFEETLPRFLQATPGPVRLAHIDCDIYQSTRTVLDLLAGRLVSGSVIVFDEYHSYAQWRDHEFKAFQEFVAARGIAYAYIGSTLFGRQAAVRLA